MTPGHQDDIILYRTQRRCWTYLATAAVLLAMTAAGCGSATSSTSPSAERTTPAAQVTSASCSSTATEAASSGVTTSAGRGGAVSSCMFVLTDGRRFKCSGPAFARSTPTPSTLEHAKTCVTISPLVIPASLRAVVARIATTRICLTSKGLRMTGGPVFPQQGPNSADGELITEGAFIAFYTHPPRQPGSNPRSSRTRDASAGRSTGTAQ